MAFFDKVKEVGSKGLDMAKDAGETAKYKIQISSTEDDIKKVFIEMGKKLLEEHADVAQELFGEEVAKIAELKEKIAGLQAAIDAVKGK
ncbi:MAG: hypothetical protein II488_04260 [Firmicutes bacterium]|jgi:hypothetical protein|nr:hypothetical protein [Bacillota bacterium]MBQ2058967.1 hypothetical protein [Bacillota bacterium]MBQ4371850.1 hypothetical protein [Bacillota bacterium]